ncbi:MAG: iron-sulfur cluster assembly protein [Bacteroidota bacterium]|nr:iron-sulfur cluster assembly protein [Bacteroidota bacterium]
MEDTFTHTDFVSIDTGVVGAGEDEIIRVTRKAIEVINSVKNQNEITDDYFLRIGTRGGGCAGMNYTLGFDSTVNDNDKIFDLDNIRMIVDAKSIFYLMGISLDYTEGNDGSGFIFRSPSDFKTCGCSH